MCVHRIKSETENGTRKFCESIEIAFSKNAHLVKMDEIE